MKRSKQAATEKQESTPGPWSHDGTLITDNDGRRVAEADGDVYGEANANAALIADAWHIPALWRVANLAWEAMNWIDQTKDVTAPDLVERLGAALDKLGETK